MSRYDSGAQPASAISPANSRRSAIELGARKAGTSKRSGAVGHEARFRRRGRTAWAIAAVPSGISGPSSYPEGFRLENPQARNLPDLVLVDRLADYLDIETHVVPRHLAEIDDLEGPAALDKGRRAVVAA